MIKARYIYLSMAAVIVAAASTVIPSMRVSTAKARPAVVEADLRNEQRIIATYLDDLFALDKEAGALGKRARLVSADLDPVERRSHDLKARLSEVQSAIREIVRKLKAANEWDDLDENIAARLTDARDKSFFQQNGLKKLLEDAANNLASHGSEIDAPIEGLRKKLSSRTLLPYADVQMVRASYEAPVPFFGTGMKCLMANLQLGLTWRLHGTESSRNQGQRLCACDSSSATCPNAAT